MYTINDFKYVLIEPQGIDGIHLQRMDFFYLSVSLALLCMPISINMFRFLCLFQIAKILSLTISKCFDPAGQWHSPIYHLMDLTSSKDLDGAKTRKMTTLLFLPVLLLVFYMLFPIVFVSSIGVPHRLCREPSATNLYQRQPRAPSLQSAIKSAYLSIRVYQFHMSPHNFSYSDTVSILQPMSLTAGTLVLCLVVYRLIQWCWGQLTSHQDPLWAPCQALYPACPITCIRLCLISAGLNFIHRPSIWIHIK